MNDGFASQIAKHLNNISGSLDRIARALDLANARRAAKDTAKKQKKAGVKKPVPIT